MSEPDKLFLRGRRTTLVSLAGMPMLHSLGLHGATAGLRLAQLKTICNLAENTHRRVLVDMHAVHERITDEKLEAGLTCSHLRSQLAMVPCAPADA